MRITRMLALGLIVSSLCLPLAYAASERPAPAAPPASLLGATQINGPFILTSGGDTTWIQVHTSSAACPGDPNMGHGGEATGGPGPLETWCFENGPGDSCGTNPPWDVRCFKHIDVRTLPSQTGINFWHIDTYRADQRAYCGSYALWCGSGALWEGQPVECGTWRNTPGYGDQWNCIVQLTLPPAFSVANGCTLFFDPRYDTECKYDYLYVDFWNGTQWNTLATFNATSNNPGGTCGAPSKPNPDYWGNTDVNRLTNCNWQARTDPNEPAFKAVIAPASLIITSGPKVRWRLVTDGAWSDADGRANTDGAAFVDNVWVWGDSQQYVEDFETGVLDPTYWSLPNPPGVIDQWHITHDPDPPYEGGDGGNQPACLLDSSFVYRARPENGYTSGAAWRNGWYYRLMTPAIPIQNSGCVIQYDEYTCALDYTCDYANEYVRFYDNDYNRWCPWIDPTPYIIYWYCYSPNYDSGDDVSTFYSESAESVQYSWDIMDVSMPGDVCRGKHTGTDLQVDNVSIGFFDSRATTFYTRGIDLLHDTFFTDLCAYNSFFDAYNPDTVSYYSGGATLPWQQQLVLTVSDPDSIDELEIVASIDGGASWIAEAMALREEWQYQDYFRGDFAGTVCPADFGLAEWARGTEVWYYVRATDGLANVEYFPATANPAHAGHTGGRDDYLEFSILPLFPPESTGPKILLVDGYGRRNYDYAPCVGQVDRNVMLEKIYGQTLTDAGYCYDTFDITGAGSNQHIHPLDYSDYDAVVWFTGPYFSNYLFDAEAQYAIRDYLAEGGKVVLCGDRIAYNMAMVGEDSLGGEFLSGIMGATYLSEMPGAFDYPYAYAVPAESLEVFGSPVAVDLEPIAIYRECPYLKDMSYVLTNPTPPSGYTAQQLMYMSNPTVAQADEVIYTEYQGQGQCVHVNFDLCASVNHSRGYCSGEAATPAPDFVAGTYDGRVELLRLILEDIFGLPSNGGGTAGRPGTEPPAYRWMLSQNVPNPWTGSTEIAFEVAQSARVSIKIFNVAGRLVQTLADERKDPGRYSVTWDGRDMAGRHVASGVYFYKMDAGSFSATKKVLLVQ